MKRTNSCLTCKHFLVEDDGEGGTVRERNSTSFSCQRSVVIRKTGQTYLMNNEMADIRAKILKHQYDYLPPNCSHYSYGDNPYHNCKNCDHAIKSGTQGIIIDTRVLGCVAKTINLDYFYNLKANGPAINPSNFLERAGELHAYDCNYSVLPHEHGSVFDTLDEEVDEAPKIREKKLYKWTAIRSNESTIKQSEYDLLVDAFRKTGCKVYRKILLISNGGEKITDGHSRIIYNLKNNRDRLERQDEFAARLQRLLRRKQTTDLLRYMSLVEDYGYLTPQQEKRLSGAEKS